MAEKQTIKLYKGSVVVEFNPDTHRYMINGKNGIPSVTSITGLLNKPALLFWSANLARDFLLDHLRAGNALTEELIMEAAKQHTIKKEREATSGSLVHDWCEKYIKHQLKVPGFEKAPPMPEDDRVVNGVTAFLSWVDEHKIKFLASEQVVYSKKHKYVGIMDCKFTMGDEKHKIIHCGDFKTSSGIYNEMLYQVSAYQGADEEESGTEFGSKWIIRFDKDTAEFEAKEFPAENHKKDYAAFLGLLAVKKRETELKK